MKSNVMVEMRRRRLRDDLTRAQMWCRVYEGTVTWANGAGLVNHAIAAQTKLNYWRSRVEELTTAARNVTERNSRR